MIAFIKSHRDSKYQEVVIDLGEDYVRYRYVKFPFVKGKVSFLPTYHRDMFKIKGEVMLIAEEGEIKEADMKKIIKKIKDGMKTSIRISKNRIADTEEQLSEWKSELEKAIELEKSL